MCIGVNCLFQHFHKHEQFLIWIAFQIEVKTEKSCDKQPKQMIEMENKNVDFIIIILCAGVDGSSAGGTREYKKCKLILSK